MGYLPLDPAANGLNLHRRERLARRIVLKQRKDAADAAEAARVSLEKLLPSVQKKGVDPVRASEPVETGEASDVIKEPILGSVLSDLLKQTSPQRVDSQ